MNKLEINKKKELSSFKIAEEKKELSSFNSFFRRSAYLDTGRRGEEIAKEYLEKKGYKIIEQNYKTKYAEIDLIARQKEDLVFVEVRTKTGEDSGSPEETINKKKLKKLLGNAIAYVARTKWKNAYRIDGICIVLKKDHSLERLNHYENITGG